MEHISYIFVLYVGEVTPTIKGGCAFLGLNLADAKTVLLDSLDEIGPKLHNSWRSQMQKLLAWGLGFVNRKHCSIAQFEAMIARVLWLWMHSWWDDVLSQIW